MLGTHHFDKTHVQDPQKSTGIPSTSTVICVLLLAVHVVYISRRG